MEFYLAIAFSFVIRRKYTRAMHLFCWNIFLCRKPEVYKNYIKFLNSNCCMLDCAGLRLLGIGRNQFIDLMNESRSNKANKLFIYNISQKFVYLLQNKSYSISIT